MVVIIGGGIIGLSIGWTLARAGQAVTIFERGQAGREATWAAAGMLTPWITPGEESLAFLKLLQASQALWPAFVEQLEQTSDMTGLGYRTEGRLFISLDHEDAAGLRDRYEFNRQYGVAAEWLSGTEARRLEPNLPQTVTNAVYLPAGHQVDNRQVALALRRAFLHAGGVLHEQTAVLDIRVEQERVQGVRTDKAFVAAETVIVAAGAWSPEIGGPPPDTAPPVRPVKGQMLAVQMPPAEPLISHVVTGEAYLIPRLDGRLLIGATVEDKGFNTEVTVGGVFHLLDKAQFMLPAVRDLPIVETWAGLRPGSPDNGPILGQTRIAGLMMATGHFRHGILLAPITAQAISQLVLDGSAAEVMRPFAPDRSFG